MREVHKDTSVLQNLSDPLYESVYQNSRKGGSVFSPRHSNKNGL